jgi:hypothetical protein
MKPEGERSRPDRRSERGKQRMIERERTRVRPDEPIPTSLGQLRWPTGSPISGGSTAV